MFFIFRFFLTQKGRFFRSVCHMVSCNARFLLPIYITKSQFCHGGSVPNVADPVKVIVVSVIIYCF